MATLTTPTTGFTRAAVSLVTLGLACTPEPECESLCGTAVIVSVSDIGTLYPPAFISLSDLEVIDQLFIRLADLDTNVNTVGDEDFTPRLARSWEFEDDLTIRFDLHSSARWHDGTPVTAHDVVFTFETYRDPATNSSSRTLINRIQSVTARDDTTAVFAFAHPYVEQFYDATNYMRIIPRHLLDTIPAAERRDHPIMNAPIGNGPYRFEAWVPTQSVELRAVADHFEGTAGIGRLVWRRLPQDLQALDALESETVDVLPSIVAPPHHQRIAEMATVRTYSSGSPYYAYMAFNFADPDDRSRPHPLFGDRELRRALVMAVDRSSIATAIFGEYGEVPDDPAPPLVRTSDLGPAQIPYDPAGAEAIFERLGWIDRDGNGVRDRGGRDLSFEALLPATSSARRNAALIMQEAFGAVGVEMTIAEVPGEVWGARSSGGDFAATIGTWGVDPSPTAVRGLWTRDAWVGTNWSRYYNPRFDALVEEASNTADAARELELWREAYSVFNNDAPVIMLYTPHIATAVHRRIENVSVRGDLWATTLWTWRIRPDAMLPRDRLR